MSANAFYKRFNYNAIPDILERWGNKVPRSLTNKNNAQ